MSPQTNNWINQKQELHMGPCLLTDRGKMSNLYRGPSIDATYQVMFQRRFFLEIDRTKTRIIPVASIFLTDQDEMSNLHKAPSIDASYHVSVHLAKRFRRSKCEKLTDDGHQMMAKAHMAFRFCFGWILDFQTCNKITSLVDTYPCII